MKVDEIEQDGVIKLVIYKDKVSVDVSAEIENYVNNGIVIKPIIVNGRMLNFDDADVKINLIHERQGDKPLIWRAIHYKVVRYNKLPYVVLLDKKDGVEYNRRGMYRLDMSVRGTFNVGESIIINDISSSGISFFTAKEKEKEVGDKIKITFPAGYEEITVTGEIVRKQENGDRILHGCTIASSMKVDRFISKEQMCRAKLLR